MMKKAFQLVMFALLAFGMTACGEKKLTQEDLKKAEATLMNEDWTMNMEVAPGVAEKYCKFVEQNPNDPAAPTWLFHAMEVNVNLKNANKCVELCNQLLDNYPDSKWSPRSLVLLGSYVYEDQLNDTASAHKALQRVIDEYPNDSLVKDAKVLIKCLGLSDQQKLAVIMMKDVKGLEWD